MTCHHVVVHLSERILAHPKRSNTKGPQVSVVNEQRSPWMELRAKDEQPRRTEDGEAGGAVLRAAESDEDEVWSRALGYTAVVGR